MNKIKSTGYLYAFGASLALAASFIFSKSVLNKVSMIQFGFVWFSMGIIWNTIWFILKRDYRELKTNLSRKLAVAISIALLEGLATGLFYIAIKAMENPAIVSFIGNIGPVFVTILGITLLKERFNIAQISGILITVGGVFIINYKSGGLAGFFDTGSVYVLIASLIYAIATIVGRKFNKSLVPGLMSLIRSVLLSITFFILLLINNESASVGIDVWKDMAFGSILETLLTIVLAYQALKMIEATRTSLIISSKSVWTLILAWIFLGVFPETYQLLGGLLTLLGVWLITWDRSLLRK